MNFAFRFGRIAAAALLASLKLPAATISTSSGFAALTVNPIDFTQIIAGAPVLNPNALAPEGLLKSPGGGFPTTVSVPAFSFTGVIPLPIFDTSINGGDSAGRFGSATVAVLPFAFGGVVMSGSVADRDVKDGKSSGAFARGSVDWINDLTGDQIGTAGGHIGFAGSVPTDGFVEAALTGSITFNGLTTPFQPIVFACAGPSYSSPNLTVAMADSFTATCSGGSFSFDGFSFARSGGAPIIFDVATGQHLIIAANLSMISDPGGTIQTTTAAPGNGPRFGAVSAAVPEPSICLSLMIGLALLAAMRKSAKR